MNTLGCLLDQARQYDEQKEDYRCPVETIHYDENGRLAMRGDGLFVQDHTLPLTPWAMGQICRRLKIPARYLRRCPGWLLSTNLNHWHQQLKPETIWLVRAYQDNVRAVLSEHYAIVNHSAILENLADLLRGVSFRLVGPHLDPHRLHLRLTTNDTRDGHYAVGCYVGNDEIGGGAIVVAPFIQRTSCTNSIIHVEGGLRRAHYRLDATFVRVMLKHEIGQALQVGADLLQNVVAAEAEALPDIAAIINQIARRKSFSEEVTATILMGTESHRTRMGLVNGLSYAAHGVEELPVDTRVGLEMLAGSILGSLQPVTQLVRDRNLLAGTPVDELLPIREGNGRNDRQPALQFGRA